MLLSRCCALDNESKSVCVRAQHFFFTAFCLSARVPWLLLMFPPFCSWSDVRVFLGDATRCGRRLFSGCHAGGIASSARFVLCCVELQWCLMLFSRAYEFRSFNCSSDILLLGYTDPFVLLFQLVVLFRSHVALQRFLTFQIGPKLESRLWSSIEHVGETFLGIRWTIGKIKYLIYFWAFWKEWSLPAYFVIGLWILVLVSERALFVRGCSTIQNVLKFRGTVCGPLLMHSWRDRLRSILQTPHCDAGTLQPDLSLERERMHCEASISTMVNLSEIKSIQKSSARIARPCIFQTIYKPQVAEFKHWQPRNFLESPTIMTKLMWPKLSYMVQNLCAISLDLACRHRALRARNPKLPAVPHRSQPRPDFF